MSTTRRITHLIGHSEWDGAAERTGDVYNPATGEVTGKVDFASVSYTHLTLPTNREV